MSRQLNKLSAATLKVSVPGKIADGGGLWFHKRVDGGAQWFLRVTVHGRTTSQTKSESIGFVMSASHM